MHILDKIYREVKGELEKKGINVSLDIIEEVVKKQFWFVTQIIGEGNWESVRLKYFGIFGVKTYRMRFKTGTSIKKIQFKDVKKGDIVKIESRSGKEIHIRI